jgi:hypothetical protein
MYLHGKRSVAFACCIAFTGQTSHEQKSRSERLTGPDRWVAFKWRTPLCRVAESETCSKEREDCYSGKSHTVCVSR